MTAYSQLERKCNKVENRMLHNSAHLSGAVHAEERLALTAQLVSAYAGNNEIQLSAFIDLITDVYNTLETLNKQTEGHDLLRPAVPISDSIHDDFLVCLEDGKRFKSLKRHLRARYNLSPEDYRRKWDLPEDYPMVAPAYARKRSRLAKQMGLGRPNI